MKVENGVQPASGFPLRAEQIRKTIKENKDLDLPAMEVMIATFRWEQITKETLSRLKSDKTGPEPKFRKKLISILKNSLSQYVYILLCILESYTFCMHLFYSMQNQNVAKHALQQYDHYMGCIGSFLYLSSFLPHEILKYTTSCST
nr:protein ROOT HAIR DEFECTIVE 3 homolog 2-like [Populus alba]